MNGWMDGWMDGCVHASVYLRTCHGTLSRRPLTAEVCGKSCGQTTLVVRVTAGASGHWMVLTLSASVRTDVGTAWHLIFIC
jgi:hypothetical protein